MKKAIISALAMLVALGAFAQKQDSLILRIELDSSTFKNVVQLIQENIKPDTKTNQIILSNILAPLYQNIKLVPREKVVADKPKETIKKP
jgi:hypothetical protein